MIKKYDDFINESTAVELDKWLEDACELHLENEEDSTIYNIVEALPDKVRSEVSDSDKDVLVSSLQTAWYKLSVGEKSTIKKKAEYAYDDMPGNDDDEEE